MDKLARRLIALCEEKNLSWRQASLAATGDGDTIRNIIRGHSKHPRIDTILSLARFFNLSVEEMLGGVPAATRLHTPDARRLRVVGRIFHGYWMDSVVVFDTYDIPIAPDPRWPAEDQQAYELGDGRYVSVLTTELDALTDGTRVVVARTIVMPPLMQIRLCRYVAGDGGQYVCEESGEAILPDDNTSVSVLGRVLWEIRYAGP